MRTDLSFVCIAPGKWRALSCKSSASGMPFMWRITVTDEGRFSIEKTDSCLLRRCPNPFLVFGDAKDYCQNREDELRELKGQQG